MHLEAFLFVKKRGKILLYKYTHSCKMAKWLASLASELGQSYAISCGGYNFDGEKREKE